MIHGYSRGGEYRWYRRDLATSTCSNHHSNSPPGSHSSRYQHVKLASSRVEPFLIFFVIENRVQNRG